MNNDMILGLTAVSLALTMTAMSGCDKTGVAKTDESAPASSTTVTYAESADDFPNPERGFYRYSQTNTSNFTPLQAAQLAGYRNAHTPTSSANYQIVSTLVYRYYVLDNFKSGPISSAVLDAMHAEMDALRDAGMKIIPRFVYTTTATPGSCPEGFICPPYGDAAKAVVLDHIAQLKPFFTANADVIACVQMGFIGTWGEQYYSDHFGDPSSNGTSGYRILDDHWADRLEVLGALLDAVPEDRMVQVRYPQLKQRFLHGIDAPVSTAAMTAADAFNGTDIARIGFHNDCFLSGTNDTGTFIDYGNDSSPRTSSASVVNAMRAYSAAEGAFVAVGGETCNDAYSPQNDCEPAGMALQEFAAMHYSYLNAHYNNEVNNDWQDGGCMLEIRKKLGYRFVLREAVFPDEVGRDTVVTVSLSVDNIGFAAPFNARPAQLLLRNVATGALHTHALDTDIRRWAPGSHTATVGFTIGTTVPAGQYELLLNLPDAYESLAGNPAYSIRLANTGVWEAATGYNKLNHQLTVH